MMHGRAPLSTPVPSDAPLAMPTPPIGEGPRGAAERTPPGRVAIRLAVLGATLILSWHGAAEMGRAFEGDSLSALQLGFWALFALAFAWIAFAAVTAVAGVLVPAPRPPEAPRITTRTALVMPLHNEAPAPSFGALAAMAEALADRGLGHAFEVFVLSDTSDPAIRLQEGAAHAALAGRLHGRMAVWYRHRPDNAGRKAGNIRDFVRHWGGRYDHMLVLDADSVMTPEAIETMVRRMEAAPRLGILQTVPRLTGAVSLMGRVQQFAAAVHGPVVARGLAAWAGADGNYWGHNALIRVRAFAAACGLPDLPGRPPFGGPILSHDFVEAALIRRAGWQVRMDTDITGSFEAPPPSLLAMAARDRRWAQGNLQHLRVIATPGLRPVSRVHLGLGAGSYLMSVVWLLLLVSGLVLSAQAAVLEPRYFTAAGQLFPDWPRFDPSRLTGLLMLSLGLLLLPKLIGLLGCLIRPAPGHGGRARLIGNGAAELVLSALIAPVLMLIQVKQIGDILGGRDSGWSAQDRRGGPLSWRLALRRHGLHSAAGLTGAVAVAVFLPAQSLWLAPVLIGLIAAPALSWLSARPVAPGSRLLATPGSEADTPVLAAAAAAAAEFAPVVAAARLEALATDHGLRRAQAASCRPGADRPAIWLDAVTARAKIDAAPVPSEALAVMTRAERMAMLGQPALMALLARRAGRTAARPPAGRMRAGE